MFNAVGFKIRFERRHDELVKIRALKEDEGFVHRDITFCFIAVPNNNNEMEIISTGMAILNPIDQYDKVLGKKIALTAALHSDDTVSFDKHTRTDIWKYFWVWVSNWHSVSVNLIKHEKTKTQNQG